MKIIDGSTFESRLFTVPPDVMASVRAIVEDVRRRGDSAITEYTEKFDRIRIEADDFRVDGEEMRRAFLNAPDSLKGALERSARRIAAFQDAQMPENVSLEVEEGVTIRAAFDPLESAGIYVPGGSAAYPSTVLMAAVPAKVAGVKRRALFTPPRREGGVPQNILAAAYLAEVDELYGIGGAQAISAMAYGTRTIRKVEKIVGPGNIYVTAAKMAVSQDVAVDMPAGPSEVLIYAESSARAEWIVADLVAQAEHDPRAKAMLVTTSRELAAEVSSKFNEACRSCERKEILQGSCNEALAIVVPDRQRGVDLINSIAPEHLQLVGSGAEEVASLIRNAGAVFIGDYAPVPLGDYAAGTNHVLPTMGWAKRASPLSVRDFLKWKEFIRCTEEGFRRIADDAMVLASSEGLPNHANAISLRLKEAGR